MSTHSLGALSTLAFQHQPKNEDFIALQARSTQIAHESAPSRNLKAESVHEMGRLPNIYLSERSRRPSALSGRGSYASDIPQLCTLSDSLKNVGEAICKSRAPSTATSRKTTAREKKAGLIQFFAICWCIYVVGWHDGSSGPLLPRIQQEYQVRLADVFCRAPHEDNHCSFRSPPYQ